MPKSDFLIMWLIRLNSDGMIEKRKSQLYLNFKFDLIDIKFKGATTSSLNIVTKENDILDV